MVPLKVGRSPKVVAGAADWPGLDRWGTSEDDALAKLSPYVPRYAGVAERAGTADESASWVTAFEYVTIVDGALFSARS